MLILSCCIFACALVSMRSLDVGTDTRAYASFFQTLANGPVATRLEPGFVFFTKSLSVLGFSVTAYQAALFMLLLLTVVIATRKYFNYLQLGGGYLRFLSASLMLLFLSPMFVNASINTVRQGNASLLVFAALLSFYRRQWAQFLVFAIVATSLHYSSLLYLLFAPVLLLGLRTQRLIVGAAFVLYCTGLSAAIMRVVLPSAYDFIISYEAVDSYRSGTRIDFALFSMLWYVLPYLSKSFVKNDIFLKITQSTNIYAALLLPFFAIGFGFFSNRYLLPAWLASSMWLAAVICGSRLSILRGSLFINAGLVGSCCVFFYYVTNMVII